jgi:hypothetical protein
MSSILSGLKIASPCREPWEAMTGDARVRHCASCQLNVYNLAELTTAEAERLILEREGRLCLRLLRRADGTVLTRDCPIGMRRARRRAAVALTASVAFLASGLAFAADVSGRSEWEPQSYDSTFDRRYAAMKQKVRAVEPFRSLLEWLDPPLRMTLGR